MYFLLFLSYLDKERVTKSQSTLKVLTEGIIQETAVEQKNSKPQGFKILLYFKK